MTPPSAQTLQRLAAETGYQPDTIEKVLRLLDVLVEINRDPFLKGRLALKGGTALNVFHLDLDHGEINANLLNADDETQARISTAARDPMPMLAWKTLNVRKHSVKTRHVPTEGTQLTDPDKASPQDERFKPWDRTT